MQTMMLLRGEMAPLYPSYFVWVESLLLKNTDWLLNSVADRQNSVSLSFLESSDLVVT